MPKKLRPQEVADILCISPEQLRKISGIPGTTRTSGGQRRYWDTPAFRKFASERIAKRLDSFTRSRKYRDAKKLAWSSFCNESIRGNSVSDDDLAKRFLPRSSKLIPNLKLTPVGLSGVSNLSERQLAILGAEIKYLQHALPWWENDLRNYWIAQNASASEGVTIRK